MENSCVINGFLNALRQYNTLGSVHRLDRLRLGGANGGGSLRILVATLMVVTFGCRAAFAMEFVLAGTDHRSADASWIQASGIIEESTVEDFLEFISEGPDWLPKRIRLSSPGGNLIAGVLLGEELRRLGFATEVGSHEPHPEWPDMPYWDFTMRTPGICASACAFAFMGGVERRIDPGSRIGVHQFFTSKSGLGEAEPDIRLVREGFEQTIVALLLDYVLRMGVDGRLLVSAGLTEPDEMYWIESGDEAIRLGLVYDPERWSEWRIAVLGDGVIAESERADGQYKMAALCTDSGGAYFDLFIKDEAVAPNGWSLRSWLVDQCLPAGSYSLGHGVHQILGNRVEASSIRIVDRPGGFGLRFPLGLSPAIEGAPSFLFEDAPFGACMTERFIGNEAKMQQAMRVAFRNCIQ